MTFKEDLMKCTDAELIEELRAGDKRALIVIYDRYANDLYTHVYALVECEFKKSHENRGNFTMRIMIRVFSRLWDTHEKLRIQSNLQVYLNHLAFKMLFSVGQDSETTKENDEKFDYYG